MRLCENCGSKMAPFQPRKRVNDALMCPACASDPTVGTSVSVPQQHEAATRPKTQEELSRIANDPDWRYPTYDRWQRSVDGIKGHDIPPGWVDDGASPYPWVTDDHLKGDTHFRSVKEMAHYGRHAGHPLTAPLPASVWERHFRSQKLRGKQIIPTDARQMSRSQLQSAMASRLGISKDAHSSAEHPAHGGPLWEHMAPDLKKLHMEKFHGWSPHDLAEMGPGDMLDEHEYAHETPAIKANNSIWHTHGDAPHTHHPPTKGGLWNHLKGDYHGLDPSFLPTYSGDQSWNENYPSGDPDYASMVHQHHSLHIDPNSQVPKPHSHGADGIGTLSPDDPGLEGFHGYPPKPFDSWAQFLAHAQGTHALAPDAGLDTDSDLNALVKEHNDNHDLMQDSYNQGETGHPIHTHNDSGTQYHDVISNEPEMLQDHMQNYHGVQPDEHSHTSLLNEHHYHHKGMWGGASGLPHTHVNEEIGQPESVKAYIPPPENGVGDKAGGYKSHLVHHHGYSNALGNLDPYSAGELDDLHENLHADAPGDHTHIKPLDGVDMAPHTAVANAAPINDGEDALEQHFIEHHGYKPNLKDPTAAPGAVGSTGPESYEAAHTHVHTHASGHKQVDEATIAVPHDHGKQWKALASIDHQNNADKINALYEHLKEAPHYLNNSYEHEDGAPTDHDNFGAAYSDALSENDPSILAKWHQQDHDKDSNVAENHDHVDYSDTTPLDPGMASALKSKSPAAEPVGPAEHNWLKAHMADSGHEWSQGPIGSWTPKQLKEQHDTDHNMNAADTNHTHGHGWGSVDYTGKPNGNYVTKPGGSDDPSTPTGSQIDALKQHLKAHGFDDYLVNNASPEQAAGFHAEDHDDSKGASPHPHSLHEHDGLPALPPQSNFGLPSVPEDAKDALTKHLMGSGHNWPNVDNGWSAATLHSMHEGDHDQDNPDNPGDKAKSHGPEAHAGLPPVKPSSPINMPPGGPPSQPPGIPHHGDMTAAELGKHLETHHGWYEESPETWEQTYGHSSGNDPLVPKHEEYHENAENGDHSGAGADWSGKAYVPHTHAGQGEPAGSPPHGTPATGPISFGNFSKGEVSGSQVHHGGEAIVGREGEWLGDKEPNLVAPTSKDTVIEHLQKHHPEVTAEDYEASPFKQNEQGYLKGWHDYLHDDAKDKQPDFAPKDAHIHSMPDPTGGVLPTIAVGSHLKHDHGMPQEQIAAMTPKEFVKHHEDLHVKGDDEEMGHSHAYSAGPMVPPTKYLLNPEYSSHDPDHPDKDSWFHGTSSHFEGAPQPGDIAYQRHGRDPVYANCADTYPVGHHTALYRQAKSFGSRVMRLKFRAKNPKIYQNINHMNHDFYDRLVASGHLHDPDYPNGGREHYGGDYGGGGSCCAPILKQTYRGSWHSMETSAAQKVRDSLRADGHDAVMWRNQADGVEGKKGCWNAAPLDADKQTEVVNKNTSASGDNVSDGSRWAGAPSGWQSNNEKFTSTPQHELPNADRVKQVADARERGTLDHEFPVAPHHRHISEYGTGFHHGGGGSSYHDDDDEDNEDQYCSKCGTYGHDYDDDHCEECGDYGHDEDEHGHYCNVCEETVTDHDEDSHPYCQWCGQNALHEEHEHEDEHGEHPMSFHVDDYCPHCETLSKDNRHEHECVNCGGALPDWQKITKPGVPAQPGQTGLSVEHDEDKHEHGLYPEQKMPWEVQHGTGGGPHGLSINDKIVQEQQDKAKELKEHKEVPGQAGMFPEGTSYATSEKPTKKGPAHFPISSGHVAGYYGAHGEGGDDKDMALHLLHDHGSSPEAFLYKSHEDDPQFEGQHVYDDEMMHSHHKWLHHQGQGSNGFPQVEHQHVVSSGAYIAPKTMSHEELASHALHAHGTPDALHWSPDELNEKHQTAHTSYNPDMMNVHGQHSHNDEFPALPKLSDDQHPEDLATHLHASHGTFIDPKHRDNPDLLKALHNDQHAIKQPVASGYDAILKHNHGAGGTIQPDTVENLPYDIKKADVPHIHKAREHLITQHGLNIPIHHGMETLEHVHLQNHAGSESGVAVPHTHVFPEMEDGQKVPDWHEHPYYHMVYGHGMDPETYSHEAGEESYHDHKAIHGGNAGESHGWHASMPSDTDEKQHPMLNESYLSSAAAKSGVPEVVDPEFHMAQHHGMTQEKLKQLGSGQKAQQAHALLHSNDDMPSVLGVQHPDHLHDHTGEMIDHEHKAPFYGPMIGGNSPLIKHINAAHPEVIAEHGKPSSYLYEDEAEKFHQAHQEAHEDGSSHSHKEDPDKPLIDHPLFNHELAKHLTTTHGMDPDHVKDAALEGGNEGMNALHGEEAHSTLDPNSVAWHSHSEGELSHLHKNNEGQVQAKSVPLHIDHPYGGSYLHQHLKGEHQADAPSDWSEGKLADTHEMHHAANPEDGSIHPDHFHEPTLHHTIEDPMIQHLTGPDHGKNYNDIAHVGDLSALHNKSHFSGSAYSQPHPWQDHDPPLMPHPAHESFGPSHIGYTTEHLQAHHGFTPADLEGTDVVASHDNLHSPQYVHENGEGAMPGHFHDPSYGTVSLPKTGFELPTTPSLTQNHLLTHHNTDTHGMSPEEMSGAHAEAHAAHEHSFNHMHKGPPISPDHFHHETIDYYDANGMAAHLHHHHGVEPDQSFAKYVPGEGDVSGLNGQHNFAHHGLGQDINNGYVAHAAPVPHTHFQGYGLPTVQPAEHTFGDHYKVPEGGLMHDPAHTYSHQDMKVHLQADHGYDPSHLSFDQVVHQHQHLHKMENPQPWEHPANHGHGLSPANDVTQHALYEHLKSPPHGWGPGALHDKFKSDGLAGLEEYHESDHDDGAEAAHKHHTHTDLSSAVPIKLHEPPEEGNTPETHLVMHHGYAHHEVDGMASPWQHHIDMHFAQPDHIVQPHTEAMGAHPHAHYTDAVCENCGEHIKHDAIQGWNAKGDSGCEESPDTDEEGTGGHVPDHSTFQFHPETAMDNHPSYKQSALTVEDFFKMAGAL